MIDGFRNSFTALAGDEVWCAHSGFSWHLGRLVNPDLFRVCVSQQTAVNLTSGVGAPPVYLAQFNLGISYTNSSVPYCVGKTTHQYVIQVLDPAQSSPAALQGRHLRRLRPVPRRALAPADDVDARGPCSVGRVRSDGLAECCWNGGVEACRERDGAEPLAARRGGRRVELEVAGAEAGGVPGRDEAVGKEGAVLMSKWG